jgi:hypothetical protein
MAVSSPSWFANAKFLEPANRLPALAAAQFMISKKNAGAVAARLADDDCLTSQQFCCDGNILPQTLS